MPHTLNLIALIVTTTSLPTTTWRNGERHKSELSATFTGPPRDPSTGQLGEPSHILIVYDKAALTGPNQPIAFGQSLLVRGRLSSFRDAKISLDPVFMIDAETITILPVLEEEIREPR